jgi:hypothetical protein
MLFVAAGRFLRYGPTGCYEAEWEIVEIRARNGSRQYKPLCPRCRRVGGAIPHSALAEAERLQVRLFRNHIGAVACAWCGRYDLGVEQHHWAPLGPRAIIGLQVICALSATSVGTP